VTVKNSKQELEIEYRRACIKEVWIELGVFDVTQQQIADKLAEKCSITVDQSTISRDIKVIKQRIKDQTADDLRSELFAGYMRLIIEARGAWRKSLEDAVTETTEAIEGGSGPGSGQRLKAQTRTAGQSGNPAFLAEEQKAFKAMREMFGVDAETAGSSEDKPLHLNISNLDTVLKKAWSNGDNSDSGT